MFLWTESWYQPCHTWFHEIVPLWDVHFLLGGKAETSEVLWPEIRSSWWTELPDTESLPSLVLALTDTSTRTVTSSRWLSLASSCSVIAFYVEHLGSLEMVLSWTVMVDIFKTRAQAVSSWDRCGQLQHISFQQKQDTLPANLWSYAKAPNGANRAGSTRWCFKCWLLLLVKPEDITLTAGSY